MKNVLYTCVLAFVVLTANTAFAAAPTTPPPSIPETSERSAPLRADVEIDPIAYAFGGFSLHVGLRFSRVRIDLGAFAATLPEAMHRNPEFDAAMRGFGMKLDVYLWDDQTGPFAGIEAGVLTSTVFERDSGVASEVTRIAPGLRLGWMIPITGGFYALPWVGVGYTPGVDDRVVAGKTFTESPWTLFPTVHLGYRF
ncbi:hypothetical protein DL240_02745 [Lujinxingia litoralis]|uniref:Outer membrane protein beta-barrel domain-containing protein n=1 Tax=Lujinxingia litoralis TaxID=2211119 RepID=A0A328C947_9DELT|nr:hypothetical protein [Lujinxingia litoralis]RAL25147.1 hypothetical protein DL240_02745 [Lujinxingia litoralis]